MVNLAVSFSVTFPGSISESVRNPLATSTSNAPADSNADRTPRKLRPSFRIAAESVSASRAAKSDEGNVPGRTVRTSSPVR